MDQVDSLNEIVSPPPPLQSTAMDDVVGVTVNNAVINTSSPVITVAADLPSFHYFISEQAKSILALQELQNEVGALLEFRELVIDAFPQLAHKLPQFNNTLPSSQNVLSPTSKWEPGIRVKRKLGQQLRDQDVVVPSLVPRYRSNSQGKASRGGEVSGSTTSSSAIQDSGFCTESSKDHSSAISSRSKSRDTDDELFSILDNIHSKGTRLKLEVEYLWSKLSRKSNSYLSSGKRRCKSLDDLILKNNDGDDESPGHDFRFDCGTFLDTELLDLRRERDMLLKKMSEIESEHMANLAQTSRLLVELETISAEKRDLEERLQMAVSSETDINNKISDLHHNFLARNQWSGTQTPFAKCQLLKLMQFFKENNQIPSADEEHIDTAINQRIYYDDSEKECTETADAVPQTVSQKVDRPTNPLMKELNKNTMFRVERAKDKVEFDCKKWKSKDLGSGGECSYSGYNSKNVVVSQSDGSVRPTCSKFGDTSSTDGMTIGGKTVVATTTASVAGDHCASSIGKPDILIGFLSSHSSFLELPKGNSVSLSKEKVLSILNEYNPIELHRYLLTLSYQLEALNSQMQRMSKSRMNIFQLLNKYKFENDDLKFQLEEKNIQLEGTKAKVRVLERMRNEKLCYSTSDLMTAIPKPTMLPSASQLHDSVHNDGLHCPVSDTALLTEKAVATLSGKNNEKCADLRDHSDNNRTKTYSKRNVSKIPLKTNSTSKLPTKLVTPSKKLTSFKDINKEYSAPGPPPVYSSCISSTSSSLNNK